MGDLHRRTEVKGRGEAAQNPPAWRSEQGEDNNKGVQRRVECVEHIQHTFERWGSGLFIDRIMGRVHGSRRDPRKDKYGKISRRCRRFNWGDCHLEGILQVFYLAQEQGGDHFVVNQLGNSMIMALASSVRSLARFYAERWIRFISVRRVRRTFGILMRRWDFIGLMSGDVHCLPWDESDSGLDSRGLQVSRLGHPYATTGACPSRGSQTNRFSVSRCSALVSNWRDCSDYLLVWWRYLSYPSIAYSFEGKDF
ncbi:hypothetical protein Acr_10g0004060 [Actinidia rufa]|uniref:Uncharacterized protein n=1 Tax=Actinidia rufa TaxID=165716 RepID=A0A7J0F8P8_9ERIC|nr:hypothetical protein Acr_10g0004060 [Actinidia rufa]